DGGCDALVPVDDVEVARRAAVLHQVGALDLKALRRQHGADFHVVVAHLRGHTPAPFSVDAAVPRDTSVPNRSAIGSPSTVLTDVFVVISSLRPASRMSTTVEDTFSTSPARTGRWWTNFCSPWTTRA